MRRVQGAGLMGSLAGQQLSDVAVAAGPEAGQAGLCQPSFRVMSGGHPPGAVSSIRQGVRKGLLGAEALVSAPAVPPSAPRPPAVPSPRGTLTPASVA